MEKFLQSCDEFLTYPKNLIQHDALEHNNRAYARRLESEAYRMFVRENEDDVALDFLDLDAREKVFKPSCVRNLGDLKEQLREAFIDGQGDPTCRFVSIHAENSRAPLRISYEMIRFLFSYLQVMPSFLDFVFPFGDQEQAKDFYFTALREESFLEPKHRGLPISQLGRSGHEMRLCYNLRSVEESRREVGFPWSVRQTAVYHTFDFESGKSVWVTVKGSTSIKKRISNLAKTWDSTNFDSVGSSFAASLKVHLLLCGWSVENWRWYINDLENSLQDVTRNALCMIVDRPSTPISQPPVAPTPSLPASPRTLSNTFSFSRIGTSKSSISSPKTHSRTFSSRTLFQLGTFPNISQALTSTSENYHQEGYRGPPNGFHSAPKRVFNLVIPKVALSRFWRFLSGTSNLPENISEKEQLPITSQDTRQEPPHMPPGVEDDQDINSKESFRFSDLQHTQYIEEKAQELSLVLRLNIEVLEEMKQHYAYIMEHPELPTEIRDQCIKEIKEFEKRIRAVEKDLRLQHSRTETLLRLLADRKTFLYGILQYQSMQASEKFAKKAQESASKMEDIAQKTKQETVSMRIITLVTLFFLPGTFIGTFFSTDIVKFEMNKQNFQPRGLAIYLAICIPLMIITFLAWWWVYRSVDRGEKRRKEALEEV